MKFFTPAWHSGAIESVGPDTAFDDYRRHLAPLLPHLPPDVQRLANTNLHDGLLFSLGGDTNFLGMTLRCGDLQVGYFDLALDYFAVLQSAEFTETLEELAPVPSRKAPDLIARYCQALYNEIDVDGEWIVHRVLFTANGSYQELTVRFKELALSTHGRAKRFDTDSGDIGTIGVKSLWDR